MPFHDARNAATQLNTLMQREQWSGALAIITDWLVQEPWRTELLLQKAHILRAMQQYEQGLEAIREYRTQCPDMLEIAFYEVEFLLDLGRTTESLHLLEQLPAEQRDSARCEYYRGRVSLARRNYAGGLQELWTAFQREPTFHRALVEWAASARRHFGDRYVRRRLEALLTQLHADPAAVVGVGLAFATIDARYGRNLLRNAVDRYPDQNATKLPNGGNGAQQVQPTPDAYHAANEYLFAGRYAEAIAAYYQAAQDDPVWTVVLAPMLAEVLSGELIQPEEARRLLENALQHAPTDYRLHLCHARVFLRLGFAEEALSSANCAYALAPDADKALALVERAAANTLLDARDRALADLSRAIARQPEIRDFIDHEPILRTLLNDPKFRLLMGKHASPYPISRWERVMRWLLGE